MSAPTSGSSGSSATPSSSSGSPVPGYYPDPSIPGYIRYWNGSAWVPGTSRPAPADLPAPEAGEAGEAGASGVAGAANAAPGTQGPRAGTSGASGVPGASGVSGAAGAAGAGLDESGPMFLDEDPSAPRAQFGRAPQVPQPRPADRPGAPADADPSAPSALSAASAPAPQSPYAAPEPYAASAPQDPRASDPRSASADTPSWPRVLPPGAERPAISWGAQARQPGAWPDPETAGPPAGPPGADAPAGSAGSGEPGAWPEPRTGGPSGGTPGADAPSGPDGRGAGWPSAASAPEEGGAWPGPRGRPQAVPGQGGGPAGEAAGGRGALPQLRPGQPVARPQPFAGDARQHPGPQAGQPAQPGAQPQPQALSGQPGTPPAARPFGAEAPPQAQPRAFSAEAQAQPRPFAGEAAPQAQPFGGEGGWAARVQGLAREGGAQGWRPPPPDPFGLDRGSDRPGGLVRRFAARVIDGVVVGALTAAAAVPLGSAAYHHAKDKVDQAKLTGETVKVWLIDSTTGAELAAVLAVFLLAGILLEVLPTAKWGRTLGKKLVGLRVLDIEAQLPPGFGASLRRWLARNVLNALVVGLVGVAWCLFDRPWKQGWHDKAARTFVAGG